MRLSRICGSALLATLLGVATVNAQQVETIEINPVSMTLTVGESQTILATPRDSRGNPLITTNLSWTSLNTSVLQIQFDPSTPNVVTVTGISAGVASIEAVAEGVRQTMVIRVNAGAQTPVLPDSVLPPDVVNSTLPQVARIEPQVFGAAPVCRVGGFVGPNLLLTTYTAIRGADRITVTLNTGTTIDDATVATHDVDANLAVLVVPGANATGLTPGSDPTGTQRGWSLGQPSCSQTVALPVQVGNTVDRDMNNGQIGAPIIDRAGNLVAMALGDRDVIPMSGLSAILNRARANAAAGTTATPGQIADRENHRHGTIVVASDATGARGRVTPIEDWHWAELATEGTFPLTVNGAAGRYRVEMLTGGQVRNSETFMIVASETNNHVINLPVISAPPPQPGAEDQLVTPQGGGGGISPAIILLGLAAAGGGAFVLLGSGGTTERCPQGQTGTPPNCTTPPNNDPGSITITIPIPNN